VLDQGDVVQNKNAYVSQKEVPFPPNTVLISRTDTKGIITYVNDTFVEMSGYTREELIGKSHNIVRHPDMPPQAFKWLWDTLKERRPWRGTVKNRCKNGDHYWVRATVAPVFEGGEVIGYSSVRRPPTREHIAEAETLYRRVNQSGEQLVSRFERFKFDNWTLSRKLQFAIQITLLAALGYGQYSVFQHMKEDARAVAVSDANEMRRLMEASLDWPDPIYIRLAKGGDKVISCEDDGFAIGKAIVRRRAMKSGHILFATTGVMTTHALAAADSLAALGIDSTVLHFHTVKPLDVDALLEHAKEACAVVTVEEHSLIGGFGSAILEALSDRLLTLPPVKRLGLSDEFASIYGSQNDVLEASGLMPAQIADTTAQLFNAIIEGARR